MRRMGIIGLCVTAAMALSIVAASSASALPEFKAAKFPVTFTSVNKTGLEPTLRSNILNSAINCQTSKGKGEINQTTVSKVTVVYTWCKEGTSTNLCTSASSPIGTIGTKLLSGKIGYITKTPVNVGTELKPTTGTVIAEFTCEGLDDKVTVEGCSIGEASPLNKSQLTSVLLFEENAAKNAQKFTKLEGGSECAQTITATALLVKGKSWIMGQEEETFAEAVELKA